MQDEKEIVRKAMSIIGSIKTPKKARQSRINGRKHKGKQAESLSHANGQEITRSRENKVSEIS